MPWVPRSLVSLPFFLSSFQGLLMFYLYIIYRVLVILSRKNREKYICSIFLEAEIFNNF